MSFNWYAFSILYTSQSTFFSWDVFLDSKNKIFKGSFRQTHQSLMALQSDRKIRPRVGKLRSPDYRFSKKTNIIRIRTMNLIRNIPIRNESGGWPMQAKSFTAWETPAKSFTAWETMPVARSKHGEWAHLLRWSCCRQTCRSASLLS